MTPQDQQIQGLKQLLMQSQLHEVITQTTTLLKTNSLTSEKPIEQDFSIHAIREIMYLKCVAYRMLGQHDDAITTLHELLEKFPDYGRAFQELGYCNLAQNQQRQAAHNFYQATRFNPALLTAWLQLKKIYQREGQSQALDLCQQQIDFLSSIPKPLLGATDLVHEGQLQKAEQICRHFLKEHPHHPEAMLLLAEIGMQLKVYSDAEFLLESCVELYPENERAASAYQSVLAKLGKFPQAAEFAEKRLAKAPNSFSVSVGLAHALVGVGDLDRAIVLYQSILQQQPDRPAVWVSLGHAQKAKGNLKDAIVAYQKATELAEDFGDAYWSLANTKTYQFSDAMLAKMERQVEKQETHLDDAIHLYFALGKGWEDRGQTSNAFRCYRKGNALKRSTLQFDISRTEKALQAQQLAFEETSFNSHQGCQANDPIFIVGLPRAGSTLLEQILASHPQVDGTMELHDILGIASSLSHHEKPYPFNIAELNDQELQSLGERYISQTQAYRQSARFFIDKMPNNFIHIGLIKKILPNAKIIDARRRPMDCCFSGFKQLFGEGQEFSYSLNDIGRYYNAYESLMSHWHKVLPGQILTVHHEDVIENIEKQVRRILDFCGLEFDPACLTFHKTQRVIKTPSSEQVRQPLYKTGMNQWKPFAGELKELMEIVGHTSND